MLLRESLHNPSGRKLVDSKCLTIDLTCSFLHKGLSMSLFTLAKHLKHPNEPPQGTVKETEIYTYWTPNKKKNNAYEKICNMF